MSADIAMKLPVGRGHVPAVRVSGSRYRRTSLCAVGSFCTRDVEDAVPYGEVQWFIGACTGGDMSPPYRGAAVFRGMPAFEIRAERSDAFHYSLFVIHYSLKPCVRRVRDAARYGGAFTLIL